MSERSAQSARSEFHGAAPRPSTTGCPLRPKGAKGDADTRARLFFAYFLLAKQKKVGAPPGAHPGPGKQTHPAAKNKKGTAPKDRPPTKTQLLLMPKKGTEKKS